MDSSRLRVSQLQLLYQQFTFERNLEAFVSSVSRSYTTATLERLAMADQRVTRRAAIFALGLVGQETAIPCVGRALHDPDRGVRMLAITAARSLWARQGSRDEQRRLARIVRLNAAGQFAPSLRACTRLLGRSGELSEAWYQKAIAALALSQTETCIHACRQALEFNAWHFEAQSLMGHAFLQIGNDLWALESFRRSLSICPDLAGIRLQIGAIERRMRKLF